MVETSHYTYRVTWSKEDEEYVGLCAEFPSLSWLDESQQKDIFGAVTQRAWRFPALQQIACELSGLALKAAETGTSLNRIVSEKLARP